MWGERKGVQKEEIKIVKRYTALGFTVGHMAVVAPAAWSGAGSVFVVPLGLF